MKPYYDHAGITIYHADMRDVLPLFSDGCFRLSIADPPYGIGEVSKRAETRVSLASPTDYGEYDWDLQKWDGSHFAELMRVSANQIIFGGNHYSEYLPSSSGWIVWDKDNSGDFSDCELAWTSFHVGIRRFKWRWNGMLQADMRNKEPRLYPTQKPKALLRWCLARYAKTGDVILDPCCGSGTALRAAFELGLSAVGIDVSERACEISASRLSQEVLTFA